MHSFKIFPLAKAFLAGIIFLLSLSCHKKVDWDHQPFNPLPVINSILVQGKPIRIHVSIANAFNSSKSSEIDNAQVNLYVDSHFAETLTYDSDGYYESTFLAESGKEYRCEVDIPGFTTAVSTTRTPVPQSIISIEYINNAGVDEEGTTYPAITLTFSNNPNLPSFYQVSITPIRDGVYGYSYLINITDPILLNEGLPIALFSNKLIDEDSYTMTINYSTGGGRITKRYPIIVELRTISEDYYRYTKTINLYENANNDPIFSGSSIVPYTLHSNVENGYGIFAGYSKVETEIIYP